MKKKRIGFPNRKISETFLDFSAPFLDSIGKGITKHQAEQVLKITYTVWNAIVLDTVKGNTKYVTMLRQTMKNDTRTSALIEQLISRKKSTFANDLRLIGEYSITKIRGEWRLRAEARDPATIP